MPENITIIGASAGSGKTTALCKRYHASLCGDNEAAAAGVASALPQQVLVTTFTRKAAAELAQRLRAKLLAEGREEDALCVEDGLIGTVHSVCLSLVREFALEMGLSPDLLPLPDTDMDRAFLFRQATAAVMQHYHGKLQALGHRLSMDAHQPYARQPGLEDWEDTVRSLCDLARANGLQPDALRAQGPANAASFLALLPEACTQAQGDTLRKELASAVQAAEKQNGDTTKQTSCAREILCDWKQHADRQWQYWHALCVVEAGQRSKPLFAKVRELAANYPRLPEFRSDVAHYIEGVFACAADALEAYTHWKKNYGLLDYNDMEALVLELLHNERASAALKGRIVQIFVDEFQDTSPLQLAVFLRLAALARHSVWVGDTKQAIYGFRGTDPVLMQAAVHAIGHNPASVLTHSWRSRPCLVDFTNAFFTAAFGAHGYPPESVRLDVPQDRQELAGRPTGLRHWRGNPKDNTTKGLAALAERIAHALRHCNAPAYQVCDKYSRQLRPLAASDIALLCRSNADCKKVAAALRESGVAVDVALEGLLQRPEVVLCLAAYRFCVDKGDSIAILELLRLTQPDMSTWLGTLLAQGNGAPLKIFEQTKLGRALDALRPLLSALSPAEALRKVAGTLDSLRFVARWGHQRQRTANVDMLHAMALRYEENCRARHSSCTHAGCIAWLVEREDAAQAPQSGREAVRVLTYHAAKGLEWPMVILCSLHHVAREYAAFGLKMCPPAADMRLDDPLAGRTVHYWPWLGGTKKSLPSLVEKQYGKHKDAEIFMQQELQEELRLLYVGMTRARDILVLYTHQASRQPAKEDAWLRAALLPSGVAWALPSGDASYFQVGERRFPALVEHGTTDRDTADEDTADAPRPQPGFPQVPSGEKPSFPPRWLSPSSLPQTNASLNHSVHALKVMLDWQGKEEPQQVGNILHAWLGVDMPALLRGDRERGERLTAFAADWQVQEADARQLPGVSERLHTALAAMATDAGFGCVTAYRVEWPVARRLGQQILSGRMDLLAVCERGLVLVDHKVEAAPASPDVYAKTIATYSGQIGAYVEALSAAGHARVLACLYLPVQGVLLEYRG